MPITVNPSDSLTDRVAASFAAAVESIVNDPDNDPETAPPDPVAPVYLRSVAQHVASRDGAPCLIVSRTPGRTEREQVRIRWRDVYTPMTAFLIGPGDQSASPAGPQWMGQTRDAIKARLRTVEYPELPELVRVMLDEAALIDLTQWDQAGLRVMVVPVVIMCRVAPAQ